MPPLGFTVQQIRRCVGELLREYGGDDGWIFIEDGYYHELREALLRNAESEYQEQGCTMPDQDPMKDMSSGDDEPPETSTLAPNTHQESTPTEIAVFSEPIAYSQSVQLDHAERDGKGIAPSTSKIPALSPPGISTPSLLPPTKSRRRFPCYGWIESDEDDDDDFITLEPASRDKILNGHYP